MLFLNILLGFDHLVISTSLFRNSKTDSMQQSAQCATVDPLNLKATYCNCYIYFSDFICSCCCTSLTHRKMESIEVNHKQGSHFQEEANNDYILITKQMEGMNTNTFLISFSSCKQHWNNSCITRGSKDKKSEPQRISYTCNLNHKTASSEQTRTIIKNT